MAAAARGKAVVISGIVKSVKFMYRRTLYLVVYHHDRAVSNPISTRDKPIFIVGCGHSGTTLLLAMLNAHPNIDGIPFESNVFYGNHSRTRIRREYEKWKTDHCAANSRILEKTPKHVRNIDRILCLFPNAKIIVVVRNGKDVCRSLKTRGMSAFTAILRWRYDNRLAIKHQGHENVYLMRYEDLIDSTERTLREVTSFLDEDYTEDLLGYHRSGFQLRPPDSMNAPNPPRPVMERRNEQISQPLFKSPPHGRDLTTWDRRLFSLFGSRTNSYLGYQ